MSYTFKQPKMTHLEPDWTYRASCPPTYSLSLQTPTIDDSPFVNSGEVTNNGNAPGKLLSFDPATREVSVFYDADNRYSGALSQQTIVLILKAQNVDGVSATENFNLVIVKDCQYTTFTSGSFPTAQL